MPDKIIKEPWVKYVPRVYKSVINKIAYLLARCLGFPYSPYGAITFLDIVLIGYHCLEWERKIIVYAKGVFESFPVILKEFIHALHPGEWHCRIGYCVVRWVYNSCSCSCLHQKAAQVVSWIRLLS